MSRAERPQRTDYTNDELVKMIAKDQFPKCVTYSQKTFIRDKYLEGKTWDAIRKLRALIEKPLTDRDKTLL